jgi:hypothetical protein
LALIYRSIFEVDDPDKSFVERGHKYVAEWLRWKLRVEELQLPDAGESLNVNGAEISIKAGADRDCRAFRISVFEGRRDDGAEVKTTATFIASETESWSWVDIERWTSDHSTRPWVPTAPGIVTSLLDNEKARRGNTILVRGPRIVEGVEGTDVAKEVADPERELPIVVVSYREVETDGLRLATERGREIAKRLAGVAPVFVLAAGAVSAFSKAMLDLVGADTDVHSGAARIYLPGVGGERDHPGRHRLFPFRKLAFRPALAGTIIAPTLMRRTVEAPPPQIWRTKAKDLIEPRADADLIEVAEAQLVEYESSIADQSVRILELEEHVDEARDSIDELLRRNDNLARNLKYVRAELAKHDAAAAHAYPPEDPFEPILCGDVAREAKERLTRVVVPDEVLVGADALDVHGDYSWARKAWLSLQAMQSYAEAKANGEFDGDFRSYCEQSAGEVVISPSWIARKESKATMSQQRFGDLRLLPVAAQVDETRRIVMEEHIKIELGGTPCPRIHYYDDTRGKTGQIHVGWFGDHLDSPAKS